MLMHWDDPFAMATKPDPPRETNERENPQPAPAGEPETEPSVPHPIRHVPQFAVTKHAGHRAVIGFFVVALTWLLALPLYLH